MAPSKKIKPIVKLATTLLKKQADKSVHKTAGLVNGKPKQRTKKLQDVTAFLSKGDETHVVPMFGGDILHSVGVLTFLQRLAQLSGLAITETEFKVSAPHSLNAFSFFNCYAVYDGHLHLWDWGKAKCPILPGLA